MSTKPLGVNRQALAEVLAGSYEARAERITEILMKDGEFFSYFNIPARTCAVLGMFEDHAVVGTDQGEFRRVFYTLGDRKDLHTLTLGWSEVIDLPLITGDNVDTYVREEARAAARLQLSGDVAGAQHILEGISPFVSGRH